MRMIVTGTVGITMLLLALLAVWAARAGTRTVSQSEGGAMPRRPSSPIKREVGEVLGARLSREHTCADPSEKLEGHQLLRTNLKQDEGCADAGCALPGTDVRKACVEKESELALKHADEASRRSPGSDTSGKESSIGVIVGAVDNLLALAPDRTYWLGARGDGDEAKPLHRAATGGFPDHATPQGAALAEVDRELFGTGSSPFLWDPALPGNPVASSPMLLGATGPELRRMEKPAQDGLFKGVDQRRVDEAIAKGVRYLKAANRPEYPHDGIGDYGALVLWTYVHAGVSEGDPKFQELFTRMMSEPLERTYKVALQAMILEEVDRVKYQDRIWQCAQYLVDNQDKEGSWGYGRLTEFSKDVPTGTPVRRSIASSGRGRSKPVPGERIKPEVVRQLAVRKTRDGSGESDNSNAQYAALGLRACHDAGILVPREVVTLASRWWRESQKSDRVVQNPRGRPSVASGLEAAGWCYGKHGHKPYGSMTAGAVGSLAIYDYMLDSRQSWKRDRDIVEGFQWLANHFSVEFNPGPFELLGRVGEENSLFHHYYYLYALERAGVLCGVEKIGRYEWDRLGANYLLDNQKPEGPWEGALHSNAVWDTCFAILFLKRATRPLEDVASTDTRNR